MIRRNIRLRKAACAERNIDGGFVGVNPRLLNRLIVSRFFNREKCLPAFAAHSNLVLILEQMVAEIFHFGNHLFRISHLQSLNFHRSHYIL